MHSLQYGDLLLVQEVVDHQKSLGDLLVLGDPRNRGGDLLVLGDPRSRGGDPLVLGDPRSHGDLQAQVGLRNLKPPPVELGTTILTT